MFVPVVDNHQQPLMPTTPAPARRWIQQNKATPFWKGSVFCVRLNQAPAARETQPIAVGIDPGSKKEALVVKSAAHTYRNIQADAVTWGKEAVLTRSQMRRARRLRKTKYGFDRPASLQPLARDELQQRLKQMHPYALAATARYDARYQGHVEPEMLLWWTHAEDSLS